MFKKQRSTEVFFLTTLQVSKGMGEGGDRKGVREGDIV